MKFNVTVHLGGASFLAGKPVPIGGKTGLSEEEADNLIENFGRWNPEDNKGGVVEADDTSAGVKAELKKAQIEAARVPELVAEVARLGVLLADRPTVEAFAAEQGKVAELEEDRDALATEVQKLTTAAEASATRIQQLEADLEEAGKKGQK